MDALDWVKKNQKYLKITQMEEDMGMGQGTLYKALTNVRNLPEKWVPTLEDKINEIKNGTVK